MAMTYAGRGHALIGSSVLASIIGVFSAACYPPHVELSSPGAEADFEERARAYERLRPKGEGEHLLIEGRTGALLQSWTFLVLEGGEEIYYAEDLLPVVPTDGDVAEAARASGALTKKARRAELAGAAIAVSGMLVFFAGLGNESTSDNLLFGVSAGIVTGGYITYRIGHRWYRRGDEQRVRAFRRYHEALLDDLALCEAGSELRPCP